MIVALSCPVALAVPIVSVSSVPMPNSPARQVSTGTQKSTPVTGRPMPTVASILALNVNKENGSYFEYHRSIKRSIKKRNSIIIEMSLEFHQLNQSVLSMGGSLN